MLNIPLPPPSIEHRNSMPGSTLPPNFSTISTDEQEAIHEGHSNDGSLFPDAPTEPLFAFLGPEAAPREVELQMREHEGEEALQRRFMRIRTRTTLRVCRIRRGGCGERGRGRE